MTRSKVHRGDIATGGRLSFLPGYICRQAYLLEVCSRLSLPLLILKTTATEQMNISYILRFCAVMADGSVREISVQAILAKDKDFRYVDSAEDREYSMNLDDEESFGGYADE